MFSVMLTYIKWAVDNKLCDTPHDAADLKKKAQDQLYVACFITCEGWQGSTRSWPS